jgi:hypothetical protein
MIGYDDIGGRKCPAGVLARAWIASGTAAVHAVARTWTEARLHIAGAVGTALATTCFDLGWIARIRDTRALGIPPADKKGFAETFGIKLQAGRADPPVGTDRLRHQRSLP